MGGSRRRRPLAPLPDDLACRRETEVGRAAGRRSTRRFDVDSGGQAGRIG